MFGKVLIVDDDTSITDLLQLILSPLNIDILYANSVKRAIETINSDNSISLLLTDICMPGKSGLDLASWVFENRQEISILAMTGHSSLQEQEKMRELGVSVVLQKPFIHLSEIVAAIISELARKNHRPMTLIADDCNTFKTFARSTLESENIPVATISHKETLSSILEKFKPSVVILDNIMPETETKRLCERYANNIRIISCSSSPEKDRLHLKEFGVREFLTKPVTSRQLVDIVTQQHENAHHS